MNLHTVWIHILSWNEVISIGSLWYCINNVSIAIYSNQDIFPWWIGDGGSTEYCCDSVELKTCNATNCPYRVNCKCPDGFYGEKCKRYFSNHILDLFGSAVILSLDAFESW